MFIATMYSYGKDSACVGVDGIRTCMGVFVAYEKMLYAIHVPWNSADKNDQGRAAFVSYVKKEAGTFRGKEARLYGVTNNKERGTAEDELRAYKKDLKPRQTVLIRLRENLGTTPDAAAVLCEYVGNGNGGNGVVQKYRSADSTGWQTGGGTTRAGYYINPSMDSVFSTPSTAVSSGWHLVNFTNSDLILL
jgi:hypothetical protein